MQSRYVGPSLNFPRACLLAAPTPLSAATEVLLVEDQLEEGCQSQSAALEEEACKAAESQLAQMGGSPLAPAALAATLADIVLAPGRLSRSALATALSTLGCAVQREQVLAADLQELRQQLPRWVAGAAATAGASAAAAAAGSSGSSAVIARWTALLRAYAAAWQQQHLPLALLQLPPQGDTTCALMLARRGGLVTALRLAAAPELALKDGLPGDWHSMASEAAESATLVLEAASAVAAAAGGSQLARLLWASMREGTDVGAILLPALVRALAGGAPAAATAAAASSGRLGFPGGSATPASAHSQWRAECRKLPLRVARLCSHAADSSTGGFAAAVAAALNILGSDYEDASRLRSSLPAVTKPIRAVLLATLAQVCVLHAALCSACCSVSAERPSAVYPVAARQATACLGPPLTHRPARSSSRLCRCPGPSCKCCPSLRCCCSTCCGPKPLHTGACCLKTACRLRQCCCRGRWTCCKQRRWHTGAP